MESIYSGIDFSGNEPLELEVLKFSSINLSWLKLHIKFYFGAKMIYFQKTSRFFLMISFNLLLITAITLGFNSQMGLASTSIKATIDPSSTQLATMSQREIMGKNKEGNSEEAQTAATEEAKRFKAATLKGMDSSIVNPEYHPSGKTQILEKQDNQDMKDIKAEASDMFKKS